MTKRSKQQLSDSSINESMVRAFLAENTSFFDNTENHEVLKKLTIPHVGKHKLSLLEYQIKIYREQHEEMYQQLQSIIEINSINQDVLNRFFNFIQEIIETNGNKELIEVFVETWKDIFSVDAISFMFPSKSKFPQLLEKILSSDSIQSNSFSIVSSNPKNITKKIIDSIETNKSFCGTINQSNRKWFSNMLTKGSYIFIPAGTKPTQSYIFLASKDTNRFSSDMHSDLVAFVCNVFTTILYSSVKKKKQPLQLSKKDVNTTDEQK